MSDFGRCAPGPAARRMQARCETGVSKSLVERWWAAQTQGKPVVEPCPGDADACFATLLWRAEAAAVLLGVNSLTETLREARMFRFPGTDLWHATLKLPRTWSGSYQFLAVNSDELDRLTTLDERQVARVIRQQGVADSRNPDSVVQYGGTVASVATMPRAAHWRRGPQSPMEAVLAPNNRRAWAMNPVGADDACVLVLDGQVWADDGALSEAHYRLAKNGIAPRVIMLDSGDTSQRLRELSWDGCMGDEILRDIVPWVVQRYGKPGRLMISGEGLGGLTALKLGLRHPGQVGLVLAQSSSLPQERFQRLIGASGAALEVVMTVGKHESGLLEANRAFSKELAKAGANVHYAEFEGGHDVVHWRRFWEAGVEELLTQAAS